MTPEREETDVAVVEIDAVGEIDAVARRYAAAVRAKDVEAFCALYAPDVRALDTWGSWSHEGLDAWRGVATEWFDSLGDERVAVEMDDVRASVTGDAAHASGFVTYTALDTAGTALRSMTNRLTWVLARGADGAWVIVHEHTSVPVDPAAGAAMMQR